MIFKVKEQHLGGGEYWIVRAVDVLFFVLFCFFFVGEGGGFAQVNLI